jgi:hypothetical protein
MVNNLDLADTGVGVAVAPARPLIFLVNVMPRPRASQDWPGTPNDRVVLAGRAMSCLLK